MDFRTAITIPATPTITYNSGIVSLGSCFAVNMGEQFAYYKFPICLNPFGTLFHPIAIENVISRAIQSETYTANDFFSHNDLWHSFSFHSALSKPTLKEAITFANEQQSQLRTALQTATVCFITLGTSWVYIYNSTETIVANCHKVPQAHFSKRLLSVDEINDSLTHIIELLKGYNPELQLIFTISPVRHSKDGFFENQVSKGQLFTALYPLVTAKQVTYFPAYELLIDELRDYRFYADDMLHPSAMAISYIWERLIATYITTDTQADMKTVDNIQKGLQHHPFNPDTESHRRFLAQLAEKTARFEAKYPHIHFR